MSCNFLERGRTLPDPYSELANNLPTASLVDAHGQDLDPIMFNLY